MSLEKAAIAFAVLIVLVIGVLVLARRTSRRARVQPSSASRTPASLHFVCSGCSERFPHTKRTISAFERGTNRMFCHACHSKWVAGRPRQQQSVASKEGLSGESRARTQATHGRSEGSPRHLSSSPRARAPSGCLGTAALLVALPLVLAVYVAVT